MDNLFFFTGEESYLLRQKLNVWKDAFREKHGDLNFTVVDGNEMSLGEIMADVDTIPFMGEKRLIFIENLPEAPKTRNTDKVTKTEEKRDEQLKKFAKDLEDIPESSVVVFIQANPDKRKAFYKSLIKLAKVEEFKPMSGMVLIRWVQAEFKKAGGSIDPSVAEYLISLTGQDCWRLAQEAQKLVSYKRGEKITQNDIDHIVTPTLEANIFHFTDALSVKNHRKAIRNLHRTMANGEDLRQLFYMIVRQFRLLLQVQSYKQQYPSTNPASVAASLKIHPFVARNIMGQIDHFSSKELKDAYARLLEIDTALKTSYIRITTEDQDELALAIERFILKFCA